MFVIVACRVICTTKAKLPFSHIRRILTHWLKSLAVIIAIIPLLYMKLLSLPTVATIIILIIIIGTSISESLLLLSVFLWYYLNFCVYI